MRMPNEFSKGMRKYILEVINSLSGGEFEQIIQRVHFLLLSTKKSDQKIRADADMEETIFEQTPEYCTRINLQQQLYELSP